MYFFPAGEMHWFYSKEFTGGVRERTQSSQVGGTVRMGWWVRTTHVWTTLCPPASVSSQTAACAQLYIYYTETHAWGLPEIGDFEEIAMVGLCEMILV